MTTTGRPLPTQIRSGGDANSGETLTPLTAAPPVARMRTLLELLVIVAGAVTAYWLLVP
jgi:hypothetical protein